MTTLKNKISTYKLVLLTLIIVALIVISLVKFFWHKPQENEVIVVTKCDFNYSEFWEVVRTGMDQALSEVEIPCIFMSPKYEYEIEKQKVIIEEAIRKEPKIIILVASDYNEINAYAEKIIDAGIHLILVDSGVRLQEHKKVPFIGTNSTKAGESLGRLALSYSSGTEKDSILLAHYDGVQTSDERKKGIQEGYGVDRFIGTYSCNSDDQIAYNTTYNVLQDNKDIINVFATNENVTVGAAKAIEDLGLSDKVNLFGFDGSKKEVQYLEKGVLDYTVIQKPYAIGYMAIKEAYDFLNGRNSKNESKSNETDFLIINHENMYDVGFREILFPFNSKN